MSDIRFNNWKHQSGTGGVSQNSGGNVGIGSTLPSSKLDVGGDVKVTGIVTATTLNYTGNQNLSNRNLVINGAMLVAQRGTSSTSSGYYSVDRFEALHTGVNESPTQAQVDVASGTTPYTLGFRKALKITNGNQTGGADAGDAIYLRYRPEAQDIAGSGWNYTSTSSFITLSFWVKSSVAQNFFGVIETSDGTQKMYPFQTGSLTADTWTKVTKIIPGHADLTFNMDNGQALGINWMQFMGTSYTANSAVVDTWKAQSDTERMPDNTSTWYTTNDATLEITGVQLEVGSVATDFEHRSFGQELALCQRYYYEHANGNNAQNNNRAAICSGGMYNSSNFFGVIQFPVKMRARPSLVKTTGTDYYRIYGGNVSDGCNDAATQNWSDQAFVVNLYDSLSLTQGSGGWAETNNASALIAFNAEL